MSGELAQKIKKKDEEVESMKDKVQFLQQLLLGGGEKTASKTMAWLSKSK